MEISELDSGQVEFKTYLTDKYNHVGYGLIIRDLVTQVAAAFEAPESEVWAVIDKARLEPPMEPDQISINTN